MKFMYKLCYGLLGVGLLFSACKKDHDPTPREEAVPTANDSMYFLFQDQYLWNDVIPDSATFKPSSYSNLPEMFSKLISIKKKVNGQPIDKYSFLDQGRVASAIQEGMANDFGFEVSYNAVNDLRVIYVLDSSPAHVKGIRRSWKVTSINGDTDIDYDGSPLGNGTNINKIIQAIYNSERVTLGFTKPDGASETITLEAATYKLNPLLFTRVYTFDAKKVGYLVFHQFIGLKNAKAGLDAAFDNFIREGVSDLVIDFRYNGGGSVETAEYLANLIAPTSVGVGNTTLMYKEYLNATLMNHQSSRYLKTKLIPGTKYSWAEYFDSFVDDNAFYFSKAKTLNVPRVVFIGTGSTASASEMVISVLKPYMDVKLVGSTTYGKPVGFVGVNVGGYDMYATSLWQKNADGYGDYFDGIRPDGQDVYEDYTITWGNSNERLLKEAFAALGLNSGLRSDTRNAP
ncbi:S41 family peptidase, partial [Sphingobacterium suaedae]